MKKYVLFIRKSCPFCVDALELLEKKELEHNIIDVADSSMLAQQVKNAFNWNTFPVVLEEDNGLFKLIGGFNDLEKIFTEDD